MTDISITTTRWLSIPHYDWRDQSATDLDIRSVTRSDKDRCEAAMTMAFAPIRWHDGPGPTRFSILVHSCHW